MNSFFSWSAIIGVLTAVFGFYVSVRLDLPLGPTDVTLGCGLIFLVYLIQGLLRKSGITVALCLMLVLTVSGCTSNGTQVKLDTRSLGQSTVWLATVRNSTASELRLPSPNPLRSLAEMAGKISSEYRVSVMDLLRDGLKRELEKQKIAVGIPEERDMRLASLPFESAGAATNARTADLSGWLLLSDIRRWETEPNGLLRSWVEFRLVHIDDGKVLWARRVQRASARPSGTTLSDASTDAVNEIMRELFKG